MLNCEVGYEAIEFLLTLAKTIRDLDSGSRLASK